MINPSERKKGMDDALREQRSVVSDSRINFCHSYCGLGTDGEHFSLLGNLQVPHTTQNWALLHIRPDNLRLFVDISFCGYSFRRNDNRTLALWWNSMSDTGRINLFLRLLFAVEFESYRAKSLLQNCKISEHLSEDLHQKACSDINHDRCSIFSIFCYSILPAEILFSCW